MDENSKLLSLKVKSIPGIKYIEEEGKIDVKKLQPGVVIRRCYY